MTAINIGTNKGNICNVEMGKRFNDIHYSDVLSVVKLKYPNEKGIIIQGWAEVALLKTPNNEQNKTN